MVMAARGAIRGVTPVSRTMAARGAAREGGQGLVPMGRRGRREPGMGAVAVAQAHTPPHTGVPVVVAVEVG